MAVVAAASAGAVTKGALVQMAKTIAIIGAGCAGLGAATTLMAREDLELNVVLIDANDLIGGRAETWSDPRLPVDIGPQFIQDPEINPWAEILKTMPPYDKLDIEPIAMTPVYRIQTGPEIWTTSLAGNMGISATDSQLSGQYQIASGFANAPIMTGNAPEFCKGQQDIRLSLGSSGYGAIAESVEPWQYIASDQARQEEVESAGNLYVPGGLGTLVKRYGEKLISDNPMNLSFMNAAVTSIDDTGARRVALETADGDRLKYDFCIVTIPVGEIEKLTFLPPLSGDRIRANGFIKLGSYKKVAWRPTAFPDQDPDSIDTGNEYYLYDQERDGVWQYFRLPTDPGILICVAAGDFARRLDELPNDDVPPLIMDLLQEVYPDGDFAPLPEVPDIFTSNWTKTVYVHGAYSYTRYDSQLGSDNPVPLEARDRIAEPHGRVHFAGEATWKDAYGTIHGAYFSGERAANEILAIIDD